MADRDEILAFCDELLSPGSFDDYGPNGLQVPGSERVDVVVTGVTAQLELFERAAAAGAQLVICHHGLLWDFMPRTVDTVMSRRLKELFAADMSLAGYHLPLDAHPEIGNNALICEALGLERSSRSAHTRRHRGLRWPLGAGRAMARPARTLPRRVRRRAVHVGCRARCGALARGDLEARLRRASGRPSAVASMPSSPGSRRST